MLGSENPDRHVRPLAVVSRLRGVQDSDLLGLIPTDPPKAGGGQDGHDGPVHRKQLTFYGHGPLARKHSDGGASDRYIAEPGKLYAKKGPLRAIRRNARTGHE